MNKSKWKRVDPAKLGHRYVGTILKVDVDGGALVEGQVIAVAADRSRGVVWVTFAGDTAVRVGAENAEVGICRLGPKPKPKPDPALEAGAKALYLSGHSPGYGYSWEGLGEADQEGYIVRFEQIMAAYHAAQNLKKDGKRLSRQVKELVGEPKQPAMRCR